MSVQRSSLVSDAGGSLRESGLPLAGSMILARKPQDRALKATNPQPTRVTDRWIRREPEPRFGAGASPAEPVGPGSRWFRPLLTKPWQWTTQMAGRLREVVGTVLEIVKWAGLLSLGSLIFMPVPQRLKNYIQEYFVLGAKQLVSPKSQTDKALQAAIQPQHFQLADYRQALVRSGLGYEAKHDDVPLHAWYIKGKETQPCIIYSHGRGSTMAGMEGMLKGFMHKGYSILIYEYPLRRLNDIGAIEQRLFKAGFAASLYAQKVLNQPVCNQVIMGNSLGSAVSAQVVSALQTLGEKPKALIMVSSFPTVKEGFIQCMNRFGLGRLLNEQKISVKLDTREALRKNRNVPVLFLQGDQDKNTPLAMAEEMKGCIHPENTALKKVVPMPNTKHSLNEADYPFMVQQSEAFLEALS